MANDEGHSASYKLDLEDSSDGKGVTVAVQQTQKRVVPQASAADTISVKRLKTISADPLKQLETPHSAGQSSSVQQTSTEQIVRSTSASHVDKTVGEPKFIDRTSLIEAIVGTEIGYGDKSKVEEANVSASNVRSIKCIKDVSPTMWAFLNWCIRKKGPLVPPPVRNGPLDAMIDKKLESLKKNTGHTAAASQVVFNENDPIEKLVDFISGKSDEDTTYGTPEEKSPYQGINPYNKIVEEVMKLRRDNTALENEAVHFRNLVSTIINATQACGTCSATIQDIFQQNV